MINQIVEGIEQDIEIGSKVIFDDVVQGEKVEKVYEKIGTGKGEFVLIEITDKDGKHKLTTIPNFSRYLADLDRGIVFSLRSNKWLNPRANKRFGYVYSTLINDNNEATPISLHQLMMSAHKQVQPQDWQRFGLEIDHVDGIKDNNNIDNLRLIRHTEQYCSRVRKKMSEANTRRLTVEDVKAIKMTKETLEALEEYKQSDFCNHYSKELDVTYSTIENVVNGKSYKNVILSDEDIALINKLSEIMIVQKAEEKELVA